jgi:hypothetical protein
MFGLFKSPTFDDSVLGKITRSRGYWRGTLVLEDAGSVPLVLSGTRVEPDAQAVATARTLAAAYASWRSVIERALFEHYLPYAEAQADEECPSPNNFFPEINAPGEVWPHVSVTFAAVTPLDGMLAVEFGYTTAWDEEHTLGARFQEGILLELCGSVLSP